MLKLYFLIFLVKVPELPPPEVIKDSLAHEAEFEDSDDEFFDPLPVEDAVDASEEMFVVPLEPGVADDDSSVASAENVPYIPEAHKKKTRFRLKQFFRKFSCISKGED